MANGLSDALSNLETTSNDMPLGVVANALATTAPNLINPRARNVGGNLAAGFGAALVAGLLKYQARQQAAEETNLGKTLASQMFQAASAEERGALARSAENETVRSKLLSLASALNQQQFLNKLEIEQAEKKKLAEFAAETSPAGREAAKIKTDALLAAIGARGEQSRLTEEQKQINKKEIINLQSQNNERLKRIEADEAIRIKDTIQKNAYDRYQRGEDYTAAMKDEERRAKAHLDALDRYENQKNDLQKIEFANQLKQADGKELDPATDRLINLNTAVADRAYKLANKIEKLSFIDFKGGLKFSNFTDENIKSEFQQLLADILKAKSGTGVSQQEYDRTYDSLIGDFTGGRSSAIQALRMAGDAVNNISLISLQGSQQSVPQKYAMIEGLMKSKKGLDLPVALEKPKFVAVPEPASSLPENYDEISLFGQSPQTTPTTSQSNINQEKANVMLEKAKKALALPDNAFSPEKKQQVIQAVKDELGIDLTATGVQ